MNSKLKAVLFVILLFIPTYLAVAEYISEQSGGIGDSRYVEKMTVTDPDGTAYVFADDNREEIEFLTDISKRAREQQNLPDALEGARVFRVTYDTFNKSSDYDYYFSDDPDAAFYRTPDGKVYKIASEDAGEFLCKEYAACLYNGSRYPVLTVGGETVLPETMSWRYQLFNGTYRPMETPTIDSIRTYRMDARLSLSFNLEPDVISVSVYDGDAPIYEGNYAGLSQIFVS